MTGAPWRGRIALALAAAALALAAAPAGAAVSRGSPLAMPVFQCPGAPGPVLAQRAIERSWGPSDDSVYVTVDVPEWRSEGLAAMLSAVAPGAGQLYVGERNAIWYALVEIAGWTANRIYVHKAQTARDRAAAWAGDPSDSTSRWSFERWSLATGLDASEIEAIWSRDRQAFYQLIASNPTYLAGWSGEPAATRTTFAGERESARSHYDRATQAGWALWANHLIAALEAMHAARTHNLALPSGFGWKVESSWRGGRPAVVAALVRRF